MLVGTTMRSYWRLRLEFSVQEVKRQYLAVVHGRLSAEQEVHLPLRLMRVPRKSTDSHPHSVQSKSIVCESGRPGHGTPDEMLAISIADTLS
eukprot:Skav205341  [mRNA]  locus=scaffold3444:514139:514414:- [translate_table: standard]